ncbi:MAG: type I methionyl aminopeptidase [Candidatus Eisenbacteria bacterium]
MSIETEQDLLGMRAAGAVVRDALAAMRAAVAAGVTTAELDAVAGRVFQAAGARSAPQLVYEFPGITCISVNDEIVHGIPSRKRRLAEGDMVKLDVTAELHGYMADAAITVGVGRMSETAKRLMLCAEQAFKKGLREIRAGRRAIDVGRAVQDEVTRKGYSVVKLLQGHGIGHTIHEEPMIPNWPDPEATGWLTDGLVITLEPIIAAGDGEMFEADDGWTIRTRDGSLAAHYEHTMIVTQGAPRLLTAA